MSDTVWVLGAGFSRFLGGPLLGDLLSRKLETDVKGVFDGESKIQPEAASAVRWIYDRGRAWVDGRQTQSHSPAGERVWDNAEEFLSTLDLAVENHAASQRIARWLGEFPKTPGFTCDVGKLRATARRMVAAECSAFILHAEHFPERWEPYRRWAEHRRFNDAIITFNYDLVLEKLAEGFENSPSVRYKVVLPAEEIPRDRVPIFKLHGSVDWRRDANGTVSIDSSRTPFLSCEDDEEMMIAAPGPSKRTAMVPLASLWTRALERLKSAETIVFVGYRFPPSDVDALTRFFEALVANDRPRLRIHCALGPNRQHADRVGEICSRAFERSVRRRKGNAVDHRFVVEPFGAEDFLPLYDAGIA